MVIKVSVIMPVYNAAEFLAEALDSICAQRLDHFELIAVNDGSTDKSLDILNDYARRNSFIKVIDQKNGGPSSARNSGLNHADGEYVYFCDSDDLMDVHCLENLYYTAKDQGADLVIAGYDIFNRNKITPVRNLDPILNQTYISVADTRILWTFSLWNKLFRRELIEQNNLRFPDTSYSEDGVFTMKYVYNARIITGINKVIYHYRRVDDARQASITTVVSQKKVADYIRSHNLIYDAACEYFQRIYPEYADVDTACSENQGVRFYLNEFIYKEVQILFNQFYKKFWSLSQETLDMVTMEINHLLSKIDLYHYSLLRNAHFEIPISQLPCRPEDWEGRYKVTLVLYADIEEKDIFIQTLRTYCVQTFVPLKIVVPEHMKNFVHENGINNTNVFYQRAITSGELFAAVLYDVKTPYIMFGHRYLHYNNTAVLNMYKAILSHRADFVTDLVHINSDGELVPVAVQKRAYDVLARCRALSRDGFLDCLYANKLISTQFLQKTNIDFAAGISGFIEQIFRKGYFLMLTSGNSIYADNEYTFPSRMLKHCSRPEVKDLICEQPVTLFSPELQNDPEEIKDKLLGYSVPKGRSEKLARIALRFFQWFPTMNKVFFMNVRKDNELEGNAKALEPYIHGRKVICSKTLPHDRLYKLKMYYHTMTSKVIICDDYNRYLRLFPLKPQQRVVQLWHACGAFKKFGRYGTNLSQKVDLATHVQYNLVCVSASNIRSIYADAFGISTAKVKSLGCPRTDVFFDKQYISAKQENLYKSYPVLSGREVIIYAPTFRDNVKGQDRTVFTPPIDFARLSHSLDENQVFVICPHPLMKNKIIPDAYPNLLEIRDFSTNDLMLVSKLLITDYSSVIFEYALLKKPMAFFCYDLDTYERGFYLNYPEDLPGEVLTNMDGLISYIGDRTRQIINDSYQRFVDNYMSACDGHSAERIAALINNYMEGRN